MERYTGLRFVNSVFIYLLISRFKHDVLGIHSSERVDGVVAFSL